MFDQHQEDNEYRYIDANWIDDVARGLTVGNEKYPNGTWHDIPPEEHAARAIRHLNMYRIGLRDDKHLINAAMRCMMAYVTDYENEAGKRD